ncbi:DUF1572 family protein [Psychrobacillus mangrovi]|uniref:DUF1572 family protein n=1 Tax=Psychrobacillus mangrovi TaxID=3117745 RepID=UPI0039B779BC
MSDSTIIHAEFVRNIRLKFVELKRDTDKAIMQMDEKAIFWSPNEQSNSVDVLVKHMSGNLISRWTDFLSTDGEKIDRDRDGEFESTIESREELLKVWEIGCEVFLKAIDSIEEKHLLQTIYIRNKSHTVLEAFIRSITHISIHVGQIIYLAKQVTPEDKWTTLSIPKKKGK